MILFATLKMIIFIGEWALYKIILNFDKTSYVISFMVQIVYNHQTLVTIVFINIQVSHQKLIFKEIFREKI